MTFNERINNSSFVNNQNQIESDWDADFGDRKIELVFIGKSLDVKSITNALESCLLSEDELIIWRKGDFPLDDKWPIKNQ